MNEDAHLEAAYEQPFEIEERDGVEVTYCENCGEPEEDCDGSCEETCEECDELLDDCTCSDIEEEDE